MCSSTPICNTCPALHVSELERARYRAGWKEGYRALALSVALCGGVGVCLTRERAECSGQDSSDGELGGILTSPTAAEALESTAAAEDKGSVPADGDATVTVVAEGGVLGDREDVALPHGTTAQWTRSKVRVSPLSPAYTYILVQHV